MNRVQTAAVIAATPDREIALGDARVTILAGASETGGACAVLDYRMPAHYAGPPAHVHLEFDEIFSVIEGRLTIRIADELHEAGPGDTIVVPGSVPHTFANRTTEGARVVIVLTPGGFESYFSEVAPLLAGGSPDLQAVGALAERYGVTTVGPGLA
jgi:mannose-6-phosphate isomerase-like protein (cupin superfamily)